ncbi:uncharacterized protein LOC142163134 [Nicotiana tabacum]|uniref:Uncharacterized protein LOC142163134 n=1 Tax=Nicotiana tabacum TaxID=4097 RepID=A0AC58RUU2_TOBAC
MHGPCGSARKSSPCMRNVRCTKHFSKKFVQNTTIDEDEYPIYKRRDNGRTIQREGIELDNREPSVERLSFHLPNEQTIIFSDDDPIDDVSNRPSVRESQFLSWFEENKTYEEARELTYAEFPLKFVWNKKFKSGKKKKFCIFNRERPKYYEDLRRINNHEHLAFRDACYALGLLDDGKEYVDAIKEAMEKKSVYDRIIIAMHEDKCGLFFLYGHGGTGKTFIWRTLSSAIRSKGAISDGMIENSIDGIEKVHILNDLLINNCDDPISIIVEGLEHVHTPEFLNTIKCSRIPNHAITLKVGVPVMLLRNIDQSSGLCNGTRLIITRLGNQVIEAKVLSGNMDGEKIFIPKISLTPSDARIPFKFQRRQFPIDVSFAMTINKSQGQSLSHVGLYLKKQDFTHR